MEFKLPELGEGVHEGELVKWKIAPGDVVKHDQAICEVMTDKATMEIPSPFEGKVDSLGAKEGEIVHVGQVLVTYGGSGSAVSASKQAPAPSAPASAPVASPTSGRPSAVAAGPSMSVSELSPERRVLAAPSTRRLARELGVELGQVSASGPHGRVMREDVERAKQGGVTKTLPSTKSQAASGAEERIPFRGMRKKISERMRLSKDRAAHFTYVEEADATEMVRLRAKAKELGEKRGIKVTYLPFVMKAMVAALKKYPTLNSTLDEERGELVLRHYYNIAVSVQTDDGLMAPVVKHVESKSVLEIASELQGIVERARSKKLALEDLQGSTITLTNVGSIGGLFATPIINYPEVAILGFNKIFKKAVPNATGGVEFRDWTYFSISLDHRIVDGAVGAEFMKEFIRFFENPSLLILEGA